MFMLNQLIGNAYQIDFGVEHGAFHRGESELGGYPGVGDEIGVALFGECGGNFQHLVASVGGGQWHLDGGF